MQLLTDFISHADAQRHFSVDRLWDLFDGNREKLNIAHECIDRHADSGLVAVRLANEDGTGEEITYREIADLSACFAHWLIEIGVEKGDRVAIMLTPSLAFYVCLFGAMKAGAVAVPLFTLFGSEGLRLRVDDCSPKVVITNTEKEPITRELKGVIVKVADQTFFDTLSKYPTTFQMNTSSADMAIYQYTSGTSSGVPTPVRHTHRSVTLLMVAALYGTGIRPGDQMFCPSSIAWGHGLWHGTLAPLAMGVTTGTISGRFEPERLCKALQEYGITALTAAATHYRMMRTSGKASKYRYQVSKLSFTGEPIDAATQVFLDETFHTSVCSMYGTTEVGTVLACYPGAPDFKVKPGTLGKPTPGLRVAVHDASGNACAPGKVGEIVIFRSGNWIPTKDLGYIDEDGFFFYGGRADDVIISSGWTMSAVEIENILLMHPDVLEAAVIGVADAIRGLIPKAYIVSNRRGDDQFASEIQQFTKTKLSLHEYPRAVSFVTELPKTAAGKVNRRLLRVQEDERKQTG